MTQQRIDLAALMPSVARALLGDPNKHLSDAREWRYRNKGSLSISLEKGTFYDWEAQEGGGVLDLIMRERKCSVGEALRWIEGMGEYVAPVAPVKSDPKRNESLRDAALRIWGECRDLEGTIAERYLRGRNLPNCTGIPDLRFHPRCPFGKDEAGLQRYVPAMVGLVRSPVDLRPMGIHRTELTADARKVDRKMLGGCVGGVVMLSPHEIDHSIGICEGIETGLAVIELGGGPVWACLSAGGINGFPYLGGISALTIYADNDAAGIEASQKCARRWLGYGVKVTIHAPHQRGADFADELATQAPGAVA